MTRLPAVTARQFVRVLQRDGFTFVRQKGSHAIFERPDGRFAIVPMHTGTLRRGTLANLMSTAGLSAERLRELL